jgi:hypothetical protein
MTQRTMTGHLQRVGTAALLSLLPSLAWAQTTATTTTIDPGLVVKRDNEVLKSVDVQYLGIKDCSGSVNFSFSVQYNTLVPVVEAWLGNGGVDCSVQTNRQPTIVGSLQRPCVLLKTVAGNTSNPELTFTGQQLLSFSNMQSSTPPPEEETPEADQDGGAGDAGAGDAGDAGTTTPSGPFPCDRVNAQKYTVYIIPMSTATTDTVSPMPIAAGYSTLKASFSVFTIAPDAPTDIEPLSGETRIGVRYERAKGTSMLTRYRAYFDTNGCDGSPLQLGADLNTSTPAPGVVASSTTQGEEIYLNGANVEVGGRVNAGVVTIDLAGNESTLSQTTCVQRVETTGFWDACQQDPTMRCEKDFESCTLSPTSRGSALGAALFALALAALVRRSGRAGKPQQRSSEDRKGG